MKKSIRDRYKFDDKQFAQHILSSIAFDSFEDLNRYVDEIEYKFESDKKNIGKRYNKELSRIDPSIDSDRKREIQEYYGEEFGTVEEIFIKQFRYSILITLYSILEMTLADLCYQLRRIKKIDLEHDELKGRGIKRARIYLSKVCKINFPDSSHEWNEIVKLNKIRNCIVHTQGNIYEANKSKELEAIIKNTKGLDIERDRYIKIDSSYIEMIQKIAKDFLNIVFENAFK